MTVTNGGRVGLRLGLASLRTYKRRFAGTLPAVLLGVSVHWGRGAGRHVRSSNVVAVSGKSQGVRQPVDTAPVRTVLGVPGVAAEPRIEGAG
ncbi:hypothetical protein [Streptomyces sp. RPT161]|uniref:hypothetical protein n=1 Tax=Streptomyces sp. RPT161 TaxID=3015993 RepID=UPI0022B8A50E|nr:hypothetical protein [Streptomyces sp. RPT161]